MGYHAKSTSGIASRLKWLGNSVVPEMVQDEFESIDVGQILKGFKSNYGIVPSLCDSIESGHRYEVVRFDLECWCWWYRGARWVRVQRS